MPTKGQYNAHNLTMLPIFQHAIESFNTRITLAQSLAEPKKYYKSINSNIDLTLQHLMTQLNLDPELLQAKPYQLSGGQLQRFNILRTLMLQPEILICDEITSNLDVLLEQQMSNVLLNYYEETQHGMVIISHDMAFITATVERIVVMRDGEIVDDFHKKYLFSAESIHTAIACCL
ncbi:ATP-binding cassette domain-containing protein [Staphylococcus arlettae]|uniref:ATP-binding cassette domain-containing protein n=1 Tax=Staphylococcus arlettae TaxID=29378 RepID=UPI001EFDB3A5|nr:ATP-binding cassette domain-containing protein [Staphylococcus arlettae]